MTAPTAAEIAEALECVDRNPAYTCAHEPECRIVLAHAYRAMEKRAAELSKELSALGYDQSLLKEDLKKVCNERDEALRELSEEKTAFEDLDALYQKTYAELAELRKREAR